MAAAAREKRESSGSAVPLPGVPNHSEAMGQGREVYPEGQRG
jgi:hypothetical protein